MQPAEISTLQNGRYTLDIVIGTGTYGSVLRCKDAKLNGSHVAVKIAHREPAYRRAALSEVNVLKILNNEPTVVRMLDSFEENGRIHLVTEMLHKNLYECMRDNKFRTTPLETVREITRVVLTALDRLHSSGYIHCDIKPENVMLRSQNSFSDCCVIDFGAVRKFSENAYYDVQSLWYRAPEVICGVPYTTAIDVWSVGCLLYELHTGNPLFQGSDPERQLACIVEMLGLPSQEAMRRACNSGRHRFVNAVNQPRVRLENCITGDPGMCQQFADLLYLLLSPNEETRCTVSEALNHPFVTGEPWNGPVTSLRKTMLSDSASENGLSSATSSPEWKRYSQFEEEDNASFWLSGLSRSPNSNVVSFGPRSIDDWP